MGLVFHYFRSILFIFLMYLWMLVIGVIGAIPAAISCNWAYAVMKLFCAGVLWLARILCGITYEIRGKYPRAIAAGDSRCGRERTRRGRVR